MGESVSHPDTVSLIYIDIIWLIVEYLGVFYNRISSGIEHIVVGSLRRCLYYARRNFVVLGSPQFCWKTS